MDFKNNRIYLQESLTDLRQKLVALDVLMHNTSIVGDPSRNRDAILNKYSRSNPFTTKNNKSSTNQCL
jgi:hypothetical protein